MVPISESQRWQLLGPRKQYCQDLLLPHIVVYIFLVVSVKTSTTQVMLAGLVWPLHSGREAGFQAFGTTRDESTFPKCSPDTDNIE